MFLKIKDRVEEKLASYIRSIDKLYSLRQISPLISENIKEFISRKGKRIRPILFVIGYLGFIKKEMPGLYRSALALELLHDFLLIHDDIIDKSDTRRGKPSIHAMFNKHLRGHKNIKFSGQDLAIVIGDIVYAMAIDTFLSIKEDPKRKEKALRMFINATIHTGSGEFIELLAGLKNMNKITKEEIYRIYDFKTAYYTFATPLAMGAQLAGANKKQVDLIFKYGMHSGRAFQIKDDILGIFGKEEEIGKSTLTDLQEAKKTILIWYAYHHSSKIEKSTIRKILTSEFVNKSDLLKIREIITTSGALQYSKKEITNLLEKTKLLSLSSQMHHQHKIALNNYFQELLQLPS